jgi:F-type H+-transporting ATPase subunit delta
VKDVSVAGRYARALFIITEKRGETVRALEDLKSLVEVFRPGTPASQLLQSPQVMLSNKRKAVQATLEKRVVHSVAVFVDLLLRKKRMRGFDTIVHEFEALVEHQQGIRRAHVVSAVPLLPVESERLHRDLETATGAKIRLTSEVDPELLGGAFVRIGDRVIDRSVRTLLETIEHQLSEVSV